MIAQDQERRRIARDLHDSAGQYLAAMQMNLNTLQKDSAIADSAKSRITDSVDLVERCMAEIRTLSYLLHPPLLDEMGLRSAIVSYVEGFAARSGIRVEVKYQTTWRGCHPRLKRRYFASCSKLANIHRHSDSRVAEIRFATQTDRITVEICDEGHGIPREKLAEFQSGKCLFGVA